MNLDKYFVLLQKGKIKKAEEYRQSEIPSKLIKFIWLDGKGTESDEKKLTSLSKEEIWFSHISQLNDPYEFKGMVLDKNKFRDAGYPEELILEYEKEFSFNEWGVTCLSGKEIDYLPMWAYYTNNHQGYCVEYDVIKKDCIHKVLYEPKRIPVASLIVEYAKAIKRALAMGKTSTEETRFLGQVFMQILFIKSKHWEHEHEYRIAYPIDNNVGKCVPISSLGLRTSKIIAGINCAEDIVDRLNDIAKSIGCGMAYKAGISETEYTLVKERIEK